MSNWSIRPPTIASKLTDVLTGREHSLEHDKEMSSYDNNYSECLRDQDIPVKYITWGLASGST